LKKQGSAATQFVLDTLRFDHVVVQKFDLKMPLIVNKRARNRVESSHQLEMPYFRDFSVESDSRVVPDILWHNDMRE